VDLEGYRQAVRSGPRKDRWRRPVRPAWPATQPPCLQNSGRFVDDAMTLCCPQSDTRISYSGWQEYG
jgi:hypothetical protein